jgi:hypothetical protein
VAAGVSYPLASQTAATFPGGTVSIPTGDS